MLVLAAFFGFAELSQGEAVGGGGRLLEEKRKTSRPETPGGNDVCLGSKEHDVGSQINPGEEPDDEGEGAVGVARALDHVADVVAAQRLQELVEDGGADRAPS